jgi:hypothetical protein
MGDSFVNAALMRGFYASVMIAVVHVDVGRADGKAVHPTNKRCSRRVDGSAVHAFNRL